MAKIIDYYVATVTSTCYVYSDSDGSGRGEQLDVGDTVVISKTASGAPLEENGYYRIDGGWVYYVNLGDITPIYETITDHCIAPVIELDTTTKALTIRGGAGGDLNEFVGYELSWRSRAIGTSAWQEEWWSVGQIVKPVSSGSTTVIYYGEAPPGHEVQYRARTVGSAGVEYYSNYVVCLTVLVGNTAPNAPTIIFPAYWMTTYSKTPVIKLNCGQDPESDSMTLYRSIDDGEWAAVLHSASGEVLDSLELSNDRAYIIKYMLVDAHGSQSNFTRVDITKAPLYWTREINAGTIISNKEISHKYDIEQMFHIVNCQCAWYGRNLGEPVGTLGRFGDWKKQMEQMENAIRSNAMFAGKTIVFDEVPAYPTASVINAIRDWASSF